MVKNKKAKYDGLAAIRAVDVAMSQGRDLEPVLEELFSGMETLAESRARAVEKPEPKPEPKTKTKKWRKS